MVVRCTLKRERRSIVPLEILTVDWLSKRLIKLGNDLLEKVQLSLATNALTVEKTAEDEFIAHAAIDVTDYSAVIKWILQKLRKKNEKKKSLEFLFRLLAVVGDDQDKVIASALDAIDEKKKAQIVALFVEEYERKLCKLLTSLLHKKSPKPFRKALMSLSFTEVKVESVL